VEKRLSVERIARAKTTGRSPGEGLMSTTSQPTLQARRPKTRCVAAGKGGKGGWT